MSTPAPEIVSKAPVPEPVMLTTFGLGVVILASIRRKP
jgi:hypothetical protein